MTVKTSPAAPATSGWRKRIPVLAVVVALVAAVVAAMTGAAKTVDAMGFVAPGHWVYNSALDSVFHVDGATSSIDARGEVGADYGEEVQVVQGDTSGYVVGDSRVTEFGKSDLEVVDETDPAADEVPVGVEVSGGPYLVYREAGKIVRLGEEPKTLSAGGPLGDPVAMRDGTLWLPRSGSRLLCTVPRDAEQVSCPVVVPEGDRGVLSVVDDRPVFVDTTSDMVHQVESDGLGEGRELGLDVPDEVQVASSDVGGRLAILDPSVNDMHLVDVAGLDPNREAHAAARVELGEGDFDGPISTGDVVAVMDRDTHMLTTYDQYGDQRAKKQLEGEQEGDPRLSRGEDDRIYVDGAEGDQVLVVDRDGEVAGVDVAEEGNREDRESTAEPDEDAQAAPGPQGPPTGDPPGSRDPRSTPPPDVPAVDPGQDRQPPPPPDDSPQVEQTPPPLPASPPGAPPAVSTSAGNASANVTWGAAPSNRGPITRYTVSWTGSGGQQGSLTTGPGARSARVNGLVNGVRYTVTVSATNSAGTGPGASAAVTPAVPVTAAGPPPNLALTYDENDRPTRDVTVSWGQPALNGGTLVHYLVSATGLGQRTVPGTSTTFPQVQADAAVTFTVQAVTRAPDGRTLTGKAASRTAQAAPATSVNLSQGEPTDQHCESSEGCTWMTIAMSGFPPNTTVTLAPHSVQNPDYSNSHQSEIGPDGNHVTDGVFAYAGVGETVYVTVTLPDGTVYESNRIEWGAG